MELVEADMIEECICEDISIENFEQELQMAQEMIKFSVSKGGIGLSAPQVGVYKKMFVWMVNEREFQVVFNPIYFKDGSKKIRTIEGCLSYPEQEFFMERYKHVRAVFYTPFMVYNPAEEVRLKKITKKLSGEKSIIFQHETQHLSGITIALRGESVDEDKRVGVAFGFKKETGDSLMIAEELKNAQNQQ